MAGCYSFSVALGILYFAVDITLWILGLMVCLNRAMMVNTIHEILDENAPNLLALQLGAGSMRYKRIERTQGMKEAAI